MLHILLTTLKVIGILLGIALGLIVTLLLIILFVPIRYKGHIKNTDIVAKITWILNIISIKIDYKEQNFKYVIKILGITINKEKKDSKGKSDKKAKKVNKSEADETNVKNNTSENKQIHEKTVDTKKTEANEQKSEKLIETTTKKKSISQKLSEVINNIKFKIRNICDKIISIKNKISDYKEFLTTDEAKTSMKDIFKMLFDLIIYILPTKLKGYIKFGLDNPETTGKVLGVICMFYGLYGDKIELEPDFENKVFEADVQFKGRIRLYKLLVVAFKLWRNEWLKKLMKFVKTH